MTKDEDLEAIIKKRIYSRNWYRNKYNTNPDFRLNEINRKFRPLKKDKTLKITITYKKIIISFD